MWWWLCGVSEITLTPTPIMYESRREYAYCIYVLCSVASLPTKTRHILCHCNSVVWQWELYTIQSFEVWRFSSEKPGDLEKIPPYLSGKSSCNSIVLAGLSSASLHWVWGCPNVYLHLPLCIHLSTENKPQTLMKQSPCTVTAESNARKKRKREKRKVCNIIGGVSLTPQLRWPKRIF